MMKAKKLSQENYYIYGLNPVLLLAGKAPERILEIKVTNKLISKFNNFKCTILSPKEFDHTFPDCNHQGVVAYIKRRKLCELDELISSDNSDKIVILDRITDIGNIGAIIRSALAFNVTKFIIPKHDSCSDLARLAKSSSGYSEIAQICEVTNLNDAVLELKEHGYWCLGLDGLANQDIVKLQDFPKLVIVLGNEHQGIRENLRKNCDMLVKIPMNPEVESLNVSVAAAIAFYTISNI